MIATAAPLPAAPPAPPAPATPGPNVGRILERMTALESALAPLRAALAKAAFEGADDQCEQIEKRIGRLMREAERLTLAAPIAARKDAEEAEWQRERLPVVLSTLYLLAAEDLTWREKLQEAHAALARLQRAWNGQMLEGRIQGIEHELREHGVPWQSRYVPMSPVPGAPVATDYPAQAEHFRQLAGRVAAEAGIPVPEQAPAVLPDLAKKMADLSGLEGAANRRELAAAQGQPAPTPATRQVARRGDLQAPRGDTHPPEGRPRDVTLPAFAPGAVARLKARVERATQPADPDEVGYDEGGGEVV